MTKVAMTGADGFLGWHTRCFLHSIGVASEFVPVGDFFDLAQAVRALDGADKLIHLAGVNRGTDTEVAEGNLRFASQMAEALAVTANPPRTVLVSNSVQAGNQTVYGTAKQAAADLLGEVTSRLGGVFVDVKLPNLFGEHGRPFYNAVTATFCHLLATGGRPEIQADRELTLLHAQHAAEVLAGVAPVSLLAERAETILVSELADVLTQLAVTYADGTIPDLTEAFHRDLFNTYRSYLIDRLPLRLVRRADARGSFFETTRVVGGQGQTSFSTTVPGVTRGDHYHRRKVERFVVLSGEAIIRIRRLFSDHVLEFPVNGLEPVAVDMPTMWTHNITNVGSGELFTQFWINEIYDPANPDTIMEAV